MKYRYDIEILINNMVQLFQKTYIGMPVLWGHILLKDVFPVLASETQSCIILKSYYAQKIQYLYLFFQY